MELLDAGGRVLPGYGKEDAVVLRSDKLEAAVRWKTHESVPAGTFRVRFWGREAEVFSFFVGEGAGRAAGSVRNGL
ncbi:MAG: hypothetical protein M1541_14260 [Acidobacteria bacterium]|nr:hypothetical protein [Acidobacteriota bacterium]